jgi:hypothetical protein
VFLEFIRLVRHRKGRCGESNIRSGSIADILDCDVCFTPQERTLMLHKRMSATGQKQTSHYLFAFKSREQKLRRFRRGFLYASVFLRAQRYGSLADISACATGVRFTPESGHSLADRPDRWNVRLVPSSRTLPARRRS